MARAKRGFKARQRRKFFMKLAKGFFAGRSRQYRMARNTVERALVYAFRGRKEKKRQYRGLWISRINAAVRPLGLSYSKFIFGLDRAGVQLDRKALADIALFDPAGFARIVELAKGAIAA